MKKCQLPIEALSAWCARNQSELHGVITSNIKDKGNGMIAKCCMGNESDTKVLLTIPRDVLVSVEYVEQYAAQDDIFRELANAVGYQVSRNSPDA